MVLVHGTSSHCHLSINQASFQFLSHLTKILPGQATVMKKWLRGDNSINIQGRIVVHGHCPSIYIPSFIEMPTVVLKLIAGQGTGWADGQSSNYLGSIKMNTWLHCIFHELFLGEQKTTSTKVCTNLLIIIL